MTELTKTIIESKRAMRRELARAPIAEKLRTLERMRERARLIKSSRPVNSTDARGAAR